MIWPIGAYQEARTWLKVREAALEYRDQLGSMGFRVDWIGRIYTVINLPEEVLTAAPQIQEGYVLMKLRDYDRMFLQLGLAGDVFPEMERIDEEGTAAFLLVLTPERDYLKLWPAVKFLIGTGLLLLAGRIAWVAALRNWDAILTAWNWATEKIGLIL
jgi:hypothetical protein